MELHRITRLVEVHMEYLHTEDNKNEIHSVAYLNINQEAMIGTDSAKKAQNNPRPAWIPAQADRNKKKKKSFYVDQNRQHGVLVLPTENNRQSFFHCEKQQTASSQLPGQSDLRNAEILERVGWRVIGNVVEGVLFWSDFNWNIYTSSQDVVEFGSTTTKVLSASIPGLTAGQIRSLSTNLPT